MDQGAEGERSLDFATASDESYGMSIELVRAYQQAAWVCLEDNTHAVPVQMAICHDGEEPYEEKIQLDWREPEESHRRSFTDRIEAVEFGATAVALFLMKHFHGFSAFERSRITTGFDFWMGKEDSFLMTEKSRLEVSGILKGSHGDTQSRSNDKVAQMAKGGVPGPGFAAVVNFGPPESQITTVENGRIP